MHTNSQFIEDEGDQNSHLPFYFLFIDIDIGFSFGQQDDGSPIDDMDWTLFFEPWI